MVTETTVGPVRKSWFLAQGGLTGRHMVSQAVSCGYDITVLVRSPERAADMEGAKIVVGDDRDEKALRQAIKGRDAVISALGTPASPFREVTLLSTAPRALFDRSARRLELHRWNTQQVGAWRSPRNVSSRM